MEVELGIFLIPYFAFYFSLPCDRFIDTIIEVFFYRLQYENVIEGISKQNFSWLRQKHVVKIFIGMGPARGLYLDYPVDQTDKMKTKF